jgi:hypothetical protein
VTQLDGFLATIWCSDIEGGFGSDGESPELMMWIEFELCYGRTVW